MTDQTKTKPQSIRLLKTTDQTLSDLAKKTGVAKSTLIRMAIAQGLPKLERAFS